jgi:hypothetical protein
VRVKKELLKLQVRLLAPTLGMRDCVKYIISNFVRLTYFPNDIRQPKLQNDTETLVMKHRIFFKETDPEDVADYFKSCFGFYPA